MTRRKVILYVAVSLDGYIARDDGSIDWLAGEDTDPNHQTFYQQIDTTLMGRKTYEQIRSFPGEFPYRKTINYVFSREKQQSNEFVQFINDNVEEFVKRLKEEDGKDIWLIGGAQLNTTLLNVHLIDQMIVTIAPIILGKGIPLFTSQAIEQKLNYSDTQILSDGYVQIKYTK